MVGRELREDEYRALQAYLLNNARSAPLCPVYEAGLVWNGAACALFLLPEGRNRLYALYALRAVYERDISAVNHELITDDPTLSALMERVIAQGALKRPARPARLPPRRRRGRR